METSGRRRSPVRSAVAVAVTTCAIAVTGASSLRPVASTGYQSKSVRLASGAQTVARWNPCQSAITWRTNLKGLRASQRAAMLKQLRTGFARLAAADGMRYRYAGSTSFVPRQQNLVDQPADIVVATVKASETDLDIGERSLGFGGVLWATWYGGQGEGAAVVRGYVVLMPDGIAHLKPGFGAGKTQGNVILHELGHATGLEHVSVASQEMYPYLTVSAPNGYRSGDLTGLRRLGRSAGCIAIPERVNIKDYS